MAVVTIKQVDEELAAWRDRLVRMSRNVSELTELPEYTSLRNRLRGAAGTALSGRTAEATTRLIASGDELARSVQLLGDAIDRADAERAKASRIFLNGDECARKAHEVLTGDTIEIVLADVPVLDRGLLGGAHEVARVSPTKLLDAISGAYTAVSTTIQEVCGAEARIAGLMARINAEIRTLCLEGWDAAMVTPDVERLERMAAADPFGAAEEAQEKLLPALASARAAMEAKRAEKAAAEGDLAGARQELKALNALCQDADAAATTCASKVKDIVLPQPDPASARELPVWLDRLEARLVEGRMEAFRVGLDRWRELLAAERGARETLMSAAKAALARREELRGRFTALKAKHAALAAAGTLPDGADDAASKLSGILFGTATPLQEAERLMTEYETILARSRRVG